VVHFDEQDGQILSCFLWWVCLPWRCFSIFWFSSGKIISNLTRIFEKLVEATQKGLTFCCRSGRTCRLLLGVRWSQIFGGFPFTEGGTAASTSRWCNPWTWGEKELEREPDLVDGRMYFYRKLEDLGIGVVFFLKDELFLRIACAGAFPRLWSNMLRCQEGLLPKHTWKESLAIPQHVELRQVLSYLCCSIFILDHGIIVVDHGNICTRLGQVTREGHGVDARPGHGGNGDDNDRGWVGILRILRWVHGEDGNGTLDDFCRSIFFSKGDFPLPYCCSLPGSPNWAPCPLK